MALRWKKNPPARGLARVAAGPRGSTLRDGEVEFAHVAVKYKGWGRDRDGWYWSARNDKFGVPWKNTSSDPVPDEATAKAQATAYVKKCLKDGAARNQTNTKD